MRDIRNNVRAKSTKNGTSNYDIYSLKNFQKLRHSYDWMFNRVVYLEDLITEHNNNGNNKKINMVGWK